MTTFRIHFQFSHLSTTFQIELNEINLLSCICWHFNSNERSNRVAGATACLAIGAKFSDFINLAVKNTDSTQFQRKKEFEFLQLLLHPTIHQLTDIPFQLKQ